MRRSHVWIALITAPILAATMIVYSNSKAGLATQKLQHVTYGFLPPAFVRFENRMTGDVIYSCLLQGAVAAEMVRHTEDEATVDGQFVPDPEPIFGKDKGFKAAMNFKGPRICP